MEFEELPEDTIDEIGGLKHGSYTIETEVKQALEEARDIPEFKQGVTGRMKALIDEAKGVITSLGEPEKDTVYVVIHVHRGVIFNVGVWTDEKEAEKIRDEWIIKEFGELVETQEGEDSIEMSKCQL